MGLAADLCKIQTEFGESMEEELKALGGILSENAELGRDLQARQGALSRVVVECSERNREISNAEQRKRQLKVSARRAARAEEAGVEEQTIEGEEPISAAALAAMAEQVVVPEPVDLVVRVKETEAEMRSAGGGEGSSATGQHRELAQLVLNRVGNIPGLTDVEEEIDDGLAVVASATTDASLICPLSRAFMENPFKAPCGHSFEKSAIDAHFQAQRVRRGGSITCPTALCSRSFTQASLRPDSTLAREIARRRAEGSLGAPSYEGVEDV